MTSAVRYALKDTLQQMEATMRAAKDLQEQATEMAIFSKRRAARAGLVSRDSHAGAFKFRLGNKFQVMNVECDSS